MSILIAIIAFPVLIFFGFVAIGLVIFVILYLFALILGIKV